MRTPVTVMLLTISAMVQAGPVEIWECKDKYVAGWETILVATTVEEGRQKGNISVAGVTHVSRFEVAGFDRRWDFGLRPDSSYRYAFIVEPNGDARYFDFGNNKTAKPSNFMECRQKRASKAPN